MSKTNKYRAICVKCNIDCEVEERELTEQDKLYCQHCKGPLDFKFVEPLPEPAQAVTYQKHSFEDSLERFVARIEARVSQPVERHEDKNFDPRNLNEADLRVEAIYQAFKALIDEAAESATTRLKVFLADKKNHNGFIQHGYSNELSSLIQEFCHNSSNFNYPDDCYYFYFYDSVLYKRVKKRLGIY